MFCSKCGNPLPDDARFCNDCGTAVAQAAPPQPMQQPQYPPVQRQPSIDFTAMKAKGKNTIRKITGEEFVYQATEPEYEKHPHPYHTLGGWLGFITYAQPIAVGLIALMCIIGFFQMTQWLRYMGGFYAAWTVFSFLIELAGYAICSFFGIKFFTMIRSKNPQFLRFYEILMIVLLSIYAVTCFMLLVGGVSPGTLVRSFADILVAIAVFCAWTAYFRKSVRVRTYFGSDEYLRRSVFSKNAQSPVPADMQPYVAPMPYAQPYSPQPTTHDQSSAPAYAPVSAADAFCSRCGAPLTSGMAFCSGCGEKRAEAPPAAPVYAAPEPIAPAPEPVFAELSPPEEPVYQEPAAYQSPAPAEYQQAPATLVGHALVTEVPYKGNGELARFYEDHVEFGEHSISYSNIVEMDTSARTSTSTIIIFYQSDFSGRIGFTLRDGQKVNIKVKGFSIYGIGTTRSARKRFQPVFSAAYNVVSKAMAQIAIAQIRQGATINIAGVNINSEGATYKKLLKKEPVYVSRSNFGACGLDGYNVRIVDKAGNKLLSTSDDNANALMLPYVLTTLFKN